MNYLIKAFCENNEVYKYAEEQFQLCEKIGMPFNEEVFIGCVSNTALTTSKSLSEAFWYHKEIHEQEKRDFLERK